MATRRRGDYYPDTMSRAARALAELQRDRAELAGLEAAGFNVALQRRICDDLLRWRASLLLDTGAPR